MGFTSKNLSYMFHKEYFSAVTTPTGDARDEKEIAQINRDFISCGVPLERRELGSHCIALQVQYPGLLPGLGYAHQTTALNGEIKGEIALGFSLDYVTGVSYIPGASVKGVIRNAFSVDDGAYVRAMLGEDVDIIQLEREIFGSGADDDGRMQDVFFDAFPSPDTPKRNDDDLFYLLDLDVITPHGTDLFAAPNPLTFVKVKPGVVFEFRFYLYGGIISANKKYALFRQILKDFGIGAKTNVGYGVLDEVDPELRISAPAQQAAFTPRRYGNVAPAPADPTGPDRMICPGCGAMNFKFRKGTTDINFSWNKNECFRCRGKLL